MPAPPARGPVLCLGKFDALHRGHRALAERARAAAGADGAVALLAFAGMAAVLGWPPRETLVAADDRPRVVGRWGLGAIGELSMDFAEVRGLDLAGFCAVLATRFAPAGLVVGEDFRGGRDRGGDAAALAAAAAAAGIAVHAVAAVADAAGPLSSTRVRAALAAGDPAAAAAMLGRPYRLLATVVRGDGRGRSIGIPTANCGERRNLAPAPGVYAGRAEVAGDGRWWPAAINIGHLPTVGGGRPLTVEAHLIGFAGGIYGQPIAVEFDRRLRDERRFASLDELRRQIAADIAAVAGC